MNTDELIKKWQGLGLENLPQEKVLPITLKLEELTEILLNRAGDCLADIFAAPVLVSLMRDHKIDDLNCLNLINIINQTGETMNLRVHSLIEDISIDKNITIFTEKFVIELSKIK